MPADDDWVLIGAETDRTLGLRNYMAYECFRSGMGRYASRVAFVEVFLANEDAEEDSWEEYRGLYLLGEKVKSSPERVPISDYDELGDRSGNLPRSTFLYFVNLPPSLAPMD